LASAHPPTPSGDPPDAVTHWRGYTLNSFQREAIAAIRADRDVLVSAPTGAGKTLVAEYAIEHCIRSGRRAITARSSLNQVPRLPGAEGVRGQDLTGDVTIRATAPS
jgi:ATP-dependent RNA helicase DOB1